MRLEPLRRFKGLCNLMHADSSRTARATPGCAGAPGFLLELSFWDNCLASFPARLHADALDGKQTDGSVVRGTGAGCNSFAYSPV